MGEIRDDVAAIFDILSANQRYVSVGGMEVERQLYPELHEGAERADPMSRE